MARDLFESPSRKEDGTVETLNTELGRTSCFAFCLHYREKIGFELCNTIWLFNYLHAVEGEDYLITLDFLKGFYECKVETFNRLILPTAAYTLECWAKGEDSDKVIYRRWPKRKDFNIGDIVVGSGNYKERTGGICLQPTMDEILNETEGFKIKGIDSDETILIFDEIDKLQLWVDINWIKRIDK